MSNSASLPSVAHGEITQGIQRNTLVEQTLAFVKSELPQWRDRPNRTLENAEEKLNAQLCKHLESRARHKLTMVQFHHEERQSGRRKVDISAGPSDDMPIEGTIQTIDEPFIVIEGKRLPPPGGASRAKEYVRGNEKEAGGIQRFKLGLHGSKHETAVMIGYVQKHTCTQWKENINSWIGDLAQQAIENEKWKESEQLTEFREDSKNKTACSKSSHSRIGNCISDTIQLHHFWIIMPPK